ncbi:HNH endonuclease signature motif containing protein [Georgenia wutianyii]|uniref:HNH endonuclease signature motif containing protein n=1 Tax=Georgenia wutianyii TaxID=2585135 RepID=UPI00143D0C06|nr:HNH endonuclease signature motif containing protein [Georgenia wutianyii]
MVAAPVVEESAVERAFASLVEYLDFDGVRLVRASVSRATSPESDDDAAPLARPAVAAAPLARSTVRARVRESSAACTPAVERPAVSRTSTPGPQSRGATALGAAVRPAACDPVAELEAMLAAAASLSGTPWHEVGGRRVHEALDLLEQLDRRLTGLRAGVVATIEAEGLWALDGQRTVQAWLRERTDATAGAASRQVRHARALRDHLPLTRQALEAGEVSGEHVTVLVREALHTDRLRAQLGEEHVGEAFLVEQAKALDAAAFTKLVKHWAVSADPESADRAWREAGTKEQLTLSRTLDGYHLAGWLDEVSGQLVDTALRSHLGRKSKDDDRTSAQRRAAALTSLARQSLDAGLQGAHSRIRPHLTVTASLETLRALAAASGSPVPPRRSDGTPHEAGADFGFWSDTALTAPGGPRDPGRGEDLFELSGEARRWMETWQPGDEHVISTTIDPRVMTGVEPATLEDGTPVPPALLARLACESGLSRVVFGPDSTVLDVGREQRIFPAHMTRAIIARDGHCQFPGCDEAPGFGEIHHSLQWYRDQGPTSVETGILLCWHHHDWVHSQNITIVRSGGQWHFYRRNGWRIGAESGEDDPPPNPTGQVCPLEASSS